MSFCNPTPRYTRDRAEAVLARALQHIPPECIREFLYPPQATHLQHLKQMLQQPRRRSLNMSINTVGSSVAPTLGESMLCVIFPSFTTGSLSAMRHIAQHVTSHFSPYKPPFISRCVRDDEHGIYVVFAGLDTALTEVDVIIQHSPSYREHATLVLATDPFRAIMDILAKGGPYDERMIRNALLLTSRIDQIRPCPSCGNRLVDCAYPLNLIKKRYPESCELYGKL